MSGVLMTLLLDTGQIFILHKKHLSLEIIKLTMYIDDKKNYLNLQILK